MQKNLHETLFPLLTSNSLHPCWLLVGREGIGKYDAALEFSIGVLKQSLHNPEGMSEKIVRHQITVGSYPNFLYLERLKDEDGVLNNEISIDQIRLLKQSLLQRPAISGWRVVVINSLDKVGRFGANALLKILEEPPVQTLFLLLCQRINPILPTLRSRCQRFNFETPATNHADLCTQIAAGSASDYAQIQTLGGQKLLEQLQGFLEQTLSRGANSMQAKAEAFAKENKAHMDFILDVFSRLLYQHIVTHHNTSEDLMVAYLKMIQLHNQAKASHLDRFHTLMLSLLLLENSKIPLKL